MIKFVSVRVALIFWITGTQAYILNTCMIMCYENQAYGERKKYISVKCNWNARSPRTGRQSPRAPSHKATVHFPRLLPSGPFQHIEPPQFSNSTRLPFTTPLFHLNKAFLFGKNIKHAHTRTWTSIFRNQIESVTSIVTRSWIEQKGGVNFSSLLDTHMGDPTGRIS